MGEAQFRLRHRAVAAIIRIPAEVNSSFPPKPFLSFIADAKANPDT
jgi:hypothetical protein